MEDIQVVVGKEIKSKKIFDEFFKNGGTTFEKGMNYETNEDFELTGGLKEFEVKEIEVYGIELK